MKNGTILFGILAMLFLFTACGAKEDIDNSENIPAESALQIEKSSTEESSGSANETVPTIFATENKKAAHKKISNSRKMVASWHCCPYRRIWCVCFHTTINRTVYALEKSFCIF